MPRDPHTPPLSSLSFDELIKVANDIEPIENLPPNVWLDRARYEAEKVRLAERGRKKEDLLVAYLRACACYMRCKTHEGSSALRKKDAGFARGVTDFKDQYESFLTKAKPLKEELKKKDAEKQANGSRPGPSRSPSGPDVHTIGNLKDRMAALQGRGMAVETTASSKRHSDMPPPTAPPKPAALSAAAAAGRARSGSGSSAKTSGSGGTGGKQVLVTASSRPLPHPQPHQLANAGHGKEDRPAVVTAAHTPHESAPAPQSGSAGSGRSRRSTLTSEDHRQGGLGVSPTVSSPLAGSPLPSPTVAVNGGPSRSPLPTSPYPASPAYHAPSPRLVASPVPVARHTPSPQPVQPPANGSDNVEADFERAFPSLSEFGKQWDTPVDLPPLPNPHPPPQTNGHAHPNGPRQNSRPSPIHEDHSDHDNSPTDIPGLPNFPSIPTTLPSVPTALPSNPMNLPRHNLPPPPSRPDFTPRVSEDGLGRVSPPTADSGTGFGVNRPASTPNVASLSLSERGPVPGGSGSGDLLNDDGEGMGNGVQPDKITQWRTQVHPPASPLNFPVAKPTPPPRDPAKLPPAAAQQPKKFPLTNAVTDDDLRGYFLSPGVEMLILDVRSEEEFKRGYVGIEYEPRLRAKINVVWIDPTVLLRDGLTSTKLEDALSLNPDPQQKMFEQRTKYDLVVVYDGRSTNWPKEGGPPTPLGRLWSLIYDHEFTKRLQRMPVLLVGGYDGWKEFIRARAERHKTRASVDVNGHGRGKPNGYGRGEVMSPTTADSAVKRSNREMPVYQPAPYAKTITENLGYTTQSMTGEPSRSYVSHSHTQSQPYPTPHQPQPKPYAPHHGHTSSYSSHGAIAAPPQASIHPGPGARRRSDYVEHSGQHYSGSASPAQPPQAGYFTSPPPGPGPGGLVSPRQNIDYPQAHALANVPMPPPAVAKPMERYDYTQQGPAVAQGQLKRSDVHRGLSAVANQRGEKVEYWEDVVLGITGLKNLGNTCYMNSTIQCLSATFPFATFFLDGSYKKSINVHNPLGTKGNLANAWAELLQVLWKETYEFLSPLTFRKNITQFAHQFSGTEQHDSQEFLSFVLDGLHEDLNRVQHKPPPVEITPEREAMLENSAPEVASESEWQIYKQRNDSLIVDLFQGQYRNRLECLTCHKTSTTYDAFMYMSLPVPAGKTKVVVQQLIDEFVKSEVMEKEDAWNCPRCKVPRRASKTLTIARLPPVLLIQLKRFTTQNGIFWDKSETPVIFPVKGLDLSRYVPRRSAGGAGAPSDPRTQVAPFKYDLYGVSNHMGTLSSGHYTAFVKSADGWKFCEDSKISPARESDVVSKPAYILFYKRVPARA
ncbi:hypothetical protein IAT38_008050 [Cryptococcus sp. DSM 104549]